MLIGLLKLKIYSYMAKLTRKEYLIRKEDLLYREIQKLNEEKQQYLLTK